MSAAARINKIDSDARWRERKEQGGPVREYETVWVIEKMRKYLPPEHVFLARDVRDLNARSRGLRVQTAERVDGAGNGSEIAMLSRLDACTMLAGYHNAVTARLDSGGSRCLFAIQEEYTLAQTLRHCGYAAGSDRSVRQLIQLTMMAAQDYDDECKAERARWRAL